MFNKKIIVYPFLIALYPVLSYWASNYSQAVSQSFYPLFLFAILAALLIFLVALALTRNLYKASFLALLLELVFFSYGHIFDLLAGKTLLGISVGKNSLLLSASLVFVLLLYFGGRQRARQWEFHKFLNVVAAILVILPALNLGYLAYLNFTSMRSYQTKLSDSGESNNVKDKPDIYYVILDGYARGDVLEDAYGYDNHEFYRQLEALGFVLPACAQSNYGYTHISMAATLNMQYMEDLSPRLNQLARKSYFEESDYLEYQPAIKKAALFNILRKQGYQIITFQTGFNWMDLSGSDVYFPYEQPVSLAGDFIKTTLLVVSQQYYVAEKLVGMDETAIVQNVLGVFFPREKGGIRYEQQRYELLQHSLDKFSEVIDYPGPKFVYLHFLAPHEPYVLAPDGRYQFITDPKVGYVNQVRFVNQKFLSLAKEIIASAKERPAVIVLQGDHGWKAPGEKRSSVLDRMKILNAYYLPGGASTKVYPEITPVNTFRLILDNYLGTNLGLVEDKRALWGKKVNLDCTRWIK
jgi:hypothetical protein